MLSSKRDELFPEMGPEVGTWEQTPFVPKLFHPTCFEWEHGYLLSERRFRGHVPTFPQKTRLAMSLLKHWLKEADSSESVIGQLGSLSSKTVDYGPGCPSPENARRPVAERCKEAMELHGELNHLFNTRAATLEAVDGLQRAEAARLAMLEVKATETYRRWLALG